MFHPVIFNYCSGDEAIMRPFFFIYSCCTGIYVCSCLTTVTTEVYTEQPRSRSTSDLFDHGVSCEAFERGCEDAPGAYSCGNDIVVGICNDVQIQIHLVTVTTSSSSIASKVKGLEPEQGTTR